MKALLFAGFLFSAASASWVRSPGNPLWVPGFQRFGDGCVTLAAADPAVIWDDSARLWKIWFASTRTPAFGSPEKKLVVEYGESADGIHWTVQDTPALSQSGPSGSWDSLDVETPSVAVNPAAPADRRYVMAYAGYNQEGAYRIGMAFSPDGRRFTRVPASESPYGKAGLVLEPAEALPGVKNMASGVVADPDILLKDGVYHMWFSSYACSGGCSPSETQAWGVSHAVSSDAVHWTADADNPVPSLRDLNGSGGAQPAVVWDSLNNRFDLWLSNDRSAEMDSLPRRSNGVYGFRKATSADGLRWTIDYAQPPDFIWNPLEKAEPLGLVTGVEAVLRQDTAWLFYTGVDSVDGPADFYVDVTPAVNPSGFAKGAFTLCSAVQRQWPLVSEKTSTSFAGGRSLSVFPTLVSEKATIHFNVESLRYLTIEVINLRGCVVASLYNGKKETGRYSIRWDCRKSNASALAAGWYFVRLTSGSTVETARILFLP